MISQSPVVAAEVNPFVLATPIEQGKGELRRRDLGFDRLALRLVATNSGLVEVRCGLLGRRKQVFVSEQPIDQLGVSD